MKLVKAKYEHACMAHESVENVGVFVEKYIYEYRGFLFRIHTWRQIELLSVWFVGILAVIGAALSYMEGGLTETVYQYIAGGAAEAVLLMVIIRMSDEPYKIKAIKMYMVDYLENVCAVRVRRQNRKEKEFIDVIPSENVNGGGKVKEQKHLPGRTIRKKERLPVQYRCRRTGQIERKTQKAPQQCRRRSMNNGGRRQSERF